MGHAALPLRMALALAGSLRSANAGQSTPGRATARTRVGEVETAVGVNHRSGDHVVAVIIEL